MIRKRESLFVIESKKLLLKGLQQVHHNLLFSFDPKRFQIEAEHLLYNHYEQPH